MQVVCGRRKKITNAIFWKQTRRWTNKTSMLVEFSEASHKRVDYMELPQGRCVD
jgi:hypothetical protein